MQIDHTSNSTIHITLTTEEAQAVRDDLGNIWASKISTAGDQLHSLLESATPEPPCCSDPTCTCNQVDAQGRCGCIRWESQPA